MDANEINLDRDRNEQRDIWMLANAAKPDRRAWQRVFASYPILASGMLDHGEGFATREGPLIVSNTYVQMNSREIAKLRADCAVLGIEAKVFVGAGWRAIPSTRIEYRRACELE